MSQAWNLDPENSTATHESGLVLSFSESGGQVNQITPRHTPKGMPAIRMVGLIREGMEFIESNLKVTAFPTQARVSSNATAAGDDSKPVVVRRKRRFPNRPRPEAAE